MLKYLKKYGGVSFDEQPLNDVDRLVFAQMAYVDFPTDARRDVPLSEILGRITFEKKEAAAEVRFWFQSKSDRELCALAAAAKRYADVRFHGFFRKTDADAPFAALSLLLPDGAQLIAFRGTDNTLKGWKEDFDLAVETEIPTQGTAKKFVEAAAQEERLLELCGHSKGGNLALYAAVFAGAQAQKQLQQAVRGEPQILRGMPAKRSDLPGIRQDRRIGTDDALRGGRRDVGVGESPAAVDAVPAGRSSS